ncbi:MAG: glycosyltransferase family 2 protein [Candidatus Omnitrophota bacterium]
MFPKVAVIILNYNGKDDTLECLESVDKIDYPHLEVVVADNGSADGSLEAIRHKFPQTKNIAHNVNLGYAEGNNRAILDAVSRGAEYILLLNNDVVVDAGIVGYLMHAIEKLPQAAFLSPKIYYFAEPNRIWFAGGYWSSRCANIISSGYQQIDDCVSWEETKETEFVFGCAMFFKADIIKHINLMSSEYFLVWEESDWCMRARKLGYKCYIVPAAKAWHKIEASFRKASDGLLRYYFWNRNRLLWMERNISWSERLYVLSVIVIPQIFKNFVGLFDFQAWSLRRLRCKVYMCAVHDYVFRRFGDAPGELYKMLKNFIAQKPETLIIITPTYPRANRIACLDRCANVFKKVDELLWIVIEDGAALNEEVTQLLKQSGINHIYLHFGPTRCWGNEQRNHALEYIRDNNIKGIVYLADDDNYYDPRLFTEIRKTKKVSIFPVGNLGPNGIERPVISGGKIIGWDAHWLDRKFPVDMAGFAFNADILQGLEGQPWNYCPADKRRGGESEFLERLVATSDELEVLCDSCTRCYAWHNLPLDVNPLWAVIHARLWKFLKRMISKM